MVSTNPSIAPRSKNHKRWLRIGLFTLLTLSGLSISTLLGRLHFEKGGKSQWLATLMQVAGFPILILYYCFSSLTNSTATSSATSPPPSATVLASVYVFLGLLVAAFCFLYSTGLRYLPVSTFSLIISSILLVSHEDSSTTNRVSRGKYAIGSICTIAASATNGLDLSLAQFCFRRVIKRESFSAVMDLIIYQSLVAASAIMVGLFVSGEWKGLKGEMEEYELGKLSYIMVLVCTCILWQVFALGSTSLLFEVSSLFANVVIVFALPVILILAVIFFDNEMDCIKAVATILALWGFLSYAYQQYLDDQESKSKHDINVNNEA